MTDDRDPAAADDADGGIVPPYLQRRVRLARELLALAELLRSRAIELYVMAGTLNRAADAAETAVHMHDPDLIDDAPADPFVD